METNELLTLQYQLAKNDKKKECIFNRILAKNKGRIQDIANLFLSRNNNYIRIEMDDVIQECNMALFIAVKTYDDSRGGNLNTYFSYIANGRLKKYLQNQLGAFVGLSSISEEEIIDNKNFEIFENEEEYIVEKKDCIEKILGKIDFLSQQHEFIFRNRHGLNRFRKPINSREIGELVGLSQQRVDKICKTYEKKLKDKINSELSNDKIKKSDYIDS